MNERLDVREKENYSERILGKFQMVRKWLFHKIFGQSNAFSEYNIVPLTYL